MTEVRTGFEAMTARECRRVLGEVEIGRVAISAGALPLVLPVQYAVRGDQLVLRTPGHHDVRDSIDGQVVGFEADQLDLVHGVGWSVSVTGMVRVVPAVASGQPVHRWFSDGVVLAMDTDIIVGHRVTA